MTHAATMFVTFILKSGYLRWHLLLSLQPAESIFDPHPGSSGDNYGGGGGGLGQTLCGYYLDRASSTMGVIGRLVLRGKLVRLTYNIFPCNNAIIICSYLPAWFLMQSGNKVPLLSLCIFLPPFLPESYEGGYAFWSMKEGWTATTVVALACTVNVVMHMINA